MQVARRVKILQPDTALLSVCRLKGSSAEDKVASGMEVAYSIVYMPESSEPFSYDLVVCTEREKFLVPCTVAGSKAALDFPDSMQFPITPAKCCASQTCLVTNVGSVDANFTLTAYSPFRVEPARAQLAAGDTMQCSLHFTPQSTGLLCCCFCMQLKLMLAGMSSQKHDLLDAPACCCSCSQCIKTLQYLLCLHSGAHTGDLEIQYEQGDLVYAKLSGDCAEVDVQLSEQAVKMQLTYINTSSQRTFRYSHMDKDIVLSVSIGRAGTMLTGFSVFLGTSMCGFPSADLGMTASCLKASMLSVP